MADQDKQTAGQRRITEDDRFHYIGFDVFPGKPKDLFTSDAEKAKLVDNVVKRRTRGELLREQCTLMIERISGAERWVLVLASLVILVSLALPWYTVYEERIVETTPTTQVQQGEEQRGEVITAVQTRKKVERETERVSGIGSFAYLGSVFSGGFGLMLTGLLGLLFTLAAIALPIYMLMTLFKTRSLDDQFALNLKKMLRLNWIPVILFVAALLVSFLGGEYGSSAASAYANLGPSYGIGPFISTVSYGMTIAIGAFVLLALKGIEI
ncbi:MAG: hypothetical protein NDJ18_07115 [candidate division Zixibacteria bacterium]|nr:hypothetical protein [candidate division Zixibacteria bacterium]